MSNVRWRLLIGAVLAHLFLSIAHGAAHTVAHVPLSRAATLFVFVVILAGPLVGLGLSWPMPRIGGWLVAITMAAALVFGCLNHFVIAGPDHVAHVDHRFRLLFAGTAILLAATEGLGAGVALHLALNGRDPG